MQLRAIARMIQTMLYAKRFFPYYVYNILGGIEEDGEPPFLLLVLFRPRHRFWYASAPYRVHSCSSTFCHCRPTIPFWATVPGNVECLPRCIRSRRMTLRHAYICRCGCRRTRHMLFSSPELSALFFPFISSSLFSVPELELTAQRGGQLLPDQRSQGPIGLCYTSSETTFMGRSGPSV